MMLSSVLAVASGGAIGAISRFATVMLMIKLLGEKFPYGTLLVNCIGSFFAGLLMVLIITRAIDNETWRLFLMVGFLGGLTTFSTFSWETWALYTSGEHLKAFLNVLANNVFSLGLAFLGMNIGRWFEGV